MAFQAGYRKGRGAVSNASGRFETTQRVAFDDGWQDNSVAEVADGNLTRRTIWLEDATRTIITTNQSPDINFDQSINPYRGCEHGCIYCFARPMHTYLGHSAGLDFERLLYAKTRAAKLLKEELAKPSYICKPIAIGVATDAYQPLEKKLGITRELLEVLAECRHPVYLITKSSLIERDIALLKDMAADDLVSVAITVTTLDNKLSHKLEPRATAPWRRLRTLETLSEAGIPTRLSVSPIIPAINEEEMERIIFAGADAGARAAYGIVLRLPHELAELFPEWLRTHYPDRADRVMKAIRSMRANKVNDSRFGDRMLGSGPRADIIRQRFNAACKRAGIVARRDIFTLNTSAFEKPQRGGQMGLF